MRHFTLLAFVSLLFCGCGFAPSKRDVQSKKDGEVLIARHFQNIATNDLDAALGDYSPQFLRSTTNEQWKKTLTNLGTYQSHTNTFLKVFNDAAGVRVTTIFVRCQVTYSKHTAPEMFVLFKGNEDSRYKIVAHTINSEALLRE